MALREFLLKPFPGDGNAPEVKISGSIRRHAGLLSVECAVRGDLRELRIPLPEAPRRMDRLWESTCFELFIGARDSSPYWEFNMSPAGHWNAYGFTSYREGMREEPAFVSLPFTAGIERYGLRLSMELDIGRLLPQHVEIEAAVCAIIESAKGGTSRWASVHPAPRPDFHRREGFTLTLAGN